MIKAFAVGFAATVAVCAMIAAIVVGEIWLLDTVTRHYGMVEAILSLIAIVAAFVGVICAAVASARRA